MKIGVHRKGIMVIALTGNEFVALGQPEYVAIKLLGKSRHFAELKKSTQSLGYKVGRYKGNEGHSYSFSVKAPNEVKPFGMEDVKATAKPKGTILISKPAMKKALKRAPVHKKKRAVAENVPAAPSVMTREDADAMRDLVAQANAMKAMYPNLELHVDSTTGVLSASMNVHLQF